MKNRILLGLLVFSCLLVIALCACTWQANEEVSEHSSQSSSDSLSEEKLLTSVSEDSFISSTAPTSQPVDGTMKMVFYGDWRVEELVHARFFLRSNGFANSNLWTIFGIQEIPQNPPMDELIIPHELAGVGTIPYVALSDMLSISYAKRLIFSEGIEGIDFSATNSIYANSVQEISFPSTLHNLIGFPFEDDSPLAFSTSMIMNNTFPSSEFSALQYIHVAQGNPLFESVDGILYQNNHLVCIPQDYHATNGTVTVRDGTQDIHVGAIYNCRKVTRLVIPDSVIDLHIDSIIATAEHPLTIVCSRNSVAAEYVENFGSLYHLTAEYTD